MPIAKLRASSTPDAMKSEEGSDSVDTFIRQAIGKEPFLSFSRTGDSPAQWILQAIDQQDPPGWPLLTPLKVQPQKCDKCSREFCSPINYRRHIRVHRRSLKVDKESHKNRDLLGSFWDKLSLDEAKDVLSFKDVFLEEVHGSSIIRTLTAFVRKPGLIFLPQVYAKAGSALLDIIQARTSSLPISSQELFSILDDASERTFLCAGTAESMQKYVFDGEAGKIGLEMKNVVACTSFVVEQKLVKAWLADKDAEALRCQKLLVEEEEAGQKRHAELLERKRQKKLRQKEQKAKDQSNGEMALHVPSDILESTPAETSSPPVTSEVNSHALDVMTDLVPAHLEPVQFSDNEEDADIEAQGGFSSQHPDSGSGQNVEPQKVQGNGRRHLVITRRQVPKSQKCNRNGFHTSQNLPLLKHEPVQKHNPHRGRAAPVNGIKVWTKKPKAENDGVRVSNRLQKEAINPTDQINCEVMIGSISVTLRNSAAQEQVNSQAEALENCSSEHAFPKKNNVPEKPIKLDSAQCGTNRSSVKFGRPVSRNGTRGQLPVQSGNQESGDDLLSGNDDDITVPREICLQSCGMDGNDSESGTDCHSPLEERVKPEGMLFSSHAAKAFLAQRWKEAISGDHTKLILFPECESPGYPDDPNDPGAAASDFHQHSILGNAENRLATVGALESATTGNAKAKFSIKPEKGAKIKYIPKHRTVT